MLIFIGCGPKEQIAKKPQEKPRVVSQLESGQPQYTPGETANFTFTVKNNDAENRKLFLISERPYFFEAYDMKNQLVWRDAKKKDAAKFQEFILLAYEQKKYTASWDCTLENGKMPKLGKYKIKAYVPVADNVKGFSDSLFIEIVD
ncbi:MAG: BsuPI-related putative proteinase inhibitor [Candidatus Zixiibacteriota bacterium]